jgi:hypothetical protein
MMNVSVEMLKRYGKVAIPLYMGDGHKPGFFRIVEAVSIPGSARLGRMDSGAALLATLLMKIK